MQYLEKLQQKLSETSFVEKIIYERGELMVEIAPDNLLQAMKTLKQEFNFEQCVDISAIDYLVYGKVYNDISDIDDMPFNIPRFAIIYHLLSISNNYRLRVKVFAKDNATPFVHSVIDIWQSANWCEREVFDLFGITFINHPDLRRILTDYGFMGHPLRKDFPLTGSVEMVYDEKSGRVIYRPVTIELREVTPRIIKD
jgi:NADH-quinone oxidoreductase subunit C